LTSVPRAEAPVVTVGAALAAARERLTEAGCDSPRLDAELLMAEVLHCDRARLVIDRDRVLGAEESAAWTALVARRVAREPVAYILGRRHFRRLTLAVDSRVLVPRPETELLVEVALGLPPESRVLDVGTGSGAVALAVKDERPDLVVRGVDVSPGALEVARGNAARLGLDVEFAAADLLDGEPADAVLANLPYVPVEAPLAPEITRYEPSEALFAGADGLDLVRRLVAAVHGPSVSLLALEIGAEQAGVVEQLLWDAGFAEVGVRQDLAGLDRVIVGTA
jgi:release factor glutamine methyltransferase